MVIGLNSSASGLVGQEFTPKFCLYFFLCIYTSWIYVHIDGIHLYYALLYSELYLVCMFPICVNHLVFVCTLPCAIVYFIIDILAFPGVVQGCTLVCDSEVYPALLYY